MIKLVYYGTGKFSAIILEKIINHNDYQVLAIVTQPDKQTGRHHILSKSPVKIIAEKYNINIYQPNTLKNFYIEELTNADIAVVAEYGLIIPNRLIQLPKKATINIHTSLLPLYRGASPIQSALINGDTETGLTLMLIDEKMDHGPIIAQKKISIFANDLAPDIFNKLSDLGINLFFETIPQFIDEHITPIEQNHQLATYCKILNRDDGKIDFTKHNNQLIHNYWRGLYPWPGIWAYLDDKRLKLIKIALSSISNLLPGEIQIINNKLFIGCANKTAIEILELQLEGKKSLSAIDFINGNKNINGKII